MAYGLPVHGEANWDTKVSDSIAAVKATADAAAPRVFMVDAPVNNATTDKAAINTQIAAANVLGGIVQLRPGTYFTDAAFTPLANGVTIQGHGGPLATVIRTTSATADIITSSGTFLIGVRDLQLESLVTRTAGSGIAFTNVEGYIVDNVRFIDTFNCGTFDTCTSGWLSRLKVAHGTATLNRGFYWVSCVDTHVQQVLINGGTITLGAGKAWFHVDSGCDTWAGMDLSAGASSGSGVVLLLTHSLSPSSFAPRWVKVTNFWFEGSSATAGQGSRGIQIDNVTNAYFTNGYSGSSDSGVYMTGGTDVRFSQVLLMNNWLYGAVASNVTGVTFRDCNFDSNSHGATGAAPHLFVAGTTTGLRVSDCTFSNAMLGNTQKVTYAIEHSVALSQDTQVRGCNFDATQYATGIIGGTAPTQLRLRDNKGLNPFGNITAPAIPATTVAYTNTLGYDCTVHVTGGTVTVIAIGGTATGFTSGTFRVPVGQTITLTYSVAPTWKWFGD